ncbi:TetR/AcrR family transcriptional regulator [Pseudidiomarina homiensis]|uniref:TetR/AcrR family transcriptional regulator n=1 Tax=Pseudidiomarina homiensis TaxID=364198 RepID=A0A432Y764_9GAMM|nr:TetR/AcrR family transcriptional regulator [Pseudidiomarina homiensis]RUO56825.1 TetR/AcrR family transcriptional regulator [Pseudidiomarina homiensis]
MSALLEKKAAFTVKLLLDAACELIETHDISELSFKMVSAHADISQRTMFRHFTSRDAFLDALTERLYSELGLPDIPSSIDALPNYVATLFNKLDAQPRKVEVLLSADLLPRVLATTAKQRLRSLTILLAQSFPKANERDITMTAANLRYVMSASSWHYYRMSFEFDLDMSIQCAQLVLKQSLDYLAAQH